MSLTSYQPCGGQEGCLLLRFVIILHNALSGRLRAWLSLFLCPNVFFLFILYCFEVNWPQYAWDGDPNTVWLPGPGSGEGAYTTLHLDEVRNAEENGKWLYTVHCAGHIGDRGRGGAVFLEQRVCCKPWTYAQLVGVDWTERWEGNQIHFQICLWI